MSTRRQKVKLRKVSMELLQRWEERKSIILSENFHVQGNEAEREARIARARRDYKYFVSTYFPHLATSESADFHIKAANEIKSNNRLRKVFMWARGLAKSSNMGCLAPLWLHIQEQPDFRFMVLVSKSNDAAVGLLQDIQAEIEENATLREDFGELKGAGDWQLGKFTTSKGVTFVALGRGQSPRGLKKKGNRPDYILIDDIDDDEIVQNPHRVAKAKEWLMSSLYGTMQAGRGRFIVVGNLISKQSILARIIEEHASFELSTVNILDSKGRPSWPQNHTIEEIRAMRIDMGERLFNKEYMNDPVVEGSIFKRKWLRYGKILPLEKYAALIAYTDPSWKSSSKNDYKATMLVGKTREGYYHVIKAYADQTTVSELVRWHYDIDSYVAQRKPVRYMMESNLIQDLLMQEFRKVGEVAGHQIPVTGDERKKPDKFSRIEALQPLFERGDIIFNEAEKSAPGMLVLVSQLLGFERGSKMHDDAPDALEGAIFLLNKRGQQTAGVFRSGRRAARHY